MSRTGDIVLLEHTGDINMDVDKILERIAKDVLDIPTLKERKSDALDFHEVSVWRLKNALKEAYNAGCFDVIQKF